MSTKYSLALTKDRIIWKKENKMMVWLTKNNIEKHHKRKYIHYHRIDRNGHNFYTHLGDWTLVREYASIRMDHRNLVYKKCLVAKGVY